MCFVWRGNQHDSVCNWSCPKKSMSGIHMAGKDTPAIESKIKLLNHRLLEQEDTLNFAFSNTSHATDIRIKYVWVRVYLYGAQELTFHTFPQWFIMNKKLKNSWSCSTHSWYKWRHKWDPGMRRYLAEIIFPNFFIPRAIWYKLANRNHKTVPSCYVNCFMWAELSDHMAWIPDVRKDSPVMLS